MTTDVFRIDVRTSIGGRMLHATERISSVAEKETTSVKLTVDQKTAAGWTVANPLYNSTKLADGWHDFALKEGTASFDSRMLIINTSDIVIHEGALSQNETWAANKLHIVRHWVRIPENITLMIAPQAVVKFCEDTGLQVDGTLNADGSVFTVIADNAVGRVVDLDGASFSLGFTTYQIIGGGVISMNGCDNRYESKAGEAEVTFSTDTFRFDLRSSVGGRMLVGEEYISPVAEEKNANAKLTVDGAPMTGWNVDSPWIDSTKLANSQWHVFALNEGKTTNEIDLLPMNRNDVVVHEGVLEENQTWEAEKLHIVRHWVRVPKDITLTVEAKAVVKFCEDTGILVDEGGKLVGGAKAVFTSVMDDSDGDDADVNGRSAAMGYGFYDITGDGTIELADCDNRGLASLVEDTVWKTGDVVHIIGQLKVPSGVSLIIQAGAIVKFATGASLVDDGGVISATGALFTHLTDDSEEAGGDTNGDGDATAPVHDAYTLPEGFEPDSDGLDANGNEIRYITPLPFNGGTIGNGVTKTLAGNRVHQVTGDIIVASGGKLVIQAGAIIKMKENGLITVNGGGTLEALGNRAQPVIITSVKDNIHGGNENTTDAQPGDWQGIHVNGGTINLQYTQIFYGGNFGSSTKDVISMWNNGSVTLDGCIVAHSLQYVAGLENGMWTMRNSVFYDFDTAFRHFANNSNINCVFYDFGNLTNNGSMHFTNCIISNYSKALLWTSWGNEYSDNSTYNNCVIWNPSGVGPQASAKTGSNGNIWADPLFTDPENGDFTLKAGSPCIDAGDGTVAPAMDHWGSPRMNVAKIADSGTPNEDGVCPDIGIYEMPGIGGGSMPDLSVSNVAFESKTYKQGDVMTVTWSDVNAGDAVAVGPWRDVVSLVRKDEQVTYVVEGDTVTVPATLKSGRTQSLSTRFRLSALLPGEWQVQVAANQYRDVFEGEGGESNIVLSEETFTVEMDGLAVGKTTLSIDGDESKTVMLAGGATAGAVLRLTVANGADISVTASAGRIPTEDDFHWRGVQVSDGQWIVEIPKGTAGDVFVTVTNNGDSSANVSIQRSNSSAIIFGTDVAEVANGGMASIVIYGAGLDKAAAAELGAVPAANIHVLSSMELVASFDLTHMAIGDYQLTVTLEGGRVLTMDGAIIVSQGAIGPRLMAGFSMPETLRPGRWYSGTITYRNDGDRDAIAPLLYLTGHDVTFLDTDDGFTEHAGHIVLAGLASDGDPSVIRPDKTYTVNVKFRGTNANASSVGIHFTFLDPNEDPLEWKMLLGGDDEMFAKRKADLEADFGMPLNLLKAAYDVCGHCSQYGRPMLDVLSVMEKLAAKPDDVEYGYVSGVMVSRDDGQALVNCSLVVDGGENDVCYVKTDAGGRFCAWGVPVGRTVTFGGPEGFYYFANKEVTLDSDQKSGVSVYRLAEDNSTPQKTHTVADYKLVKDSDGVVWMVWLADDVLYAALADDPEHTTVSLPSDVKWTEMTALPLADGGLRFFLNSTKENENEDDDVREILYTCTAMVGQGGSIEFSNAKSHDDNRSYSHLDITGLSNGKYAALWYDLSQGLQLQCMDTENSRQWEDSVIYVPVEQTRGVAVSDRLDFKIPNICDLSVIIKGTQDETCCTKHGILSASVEASFVQPGALWGLDADWDISGGGSYEKELKCQYYLDENPSGDCNPEYGVSLSKLSLGNVDVFLGAKKEFFLLGMEDILTLSFYAKIGVVGKGTFNINEQFYKNKMPSKNWDYNISWGGRIKINAKAVWGGIDDYLNNNVTENEKGNKDAVDVEGDLLFHLSGNSQHPWPQYDGCTLHFLVQLLMFQFEATGSKWENGWFSQWDTELRWEYSITTKPTRGDESYEQETIKLELTEAFPHDLVIDINSTDMTCLLDNESFTKDATCIMSTFTPDHGNALQLTGGRMLGLRNGGAACFVSKEEYVTGYKNACLLYMSIDGQNRIQDVVRLYSEDGDYVHGTIRAVEMEDENLAVLYNVSTLDYTGSISDYLQSLGRYKTCLIIRENGHWGDVMQVGDEAARSMTVCYDENQNELKIAWLEDNGNGKAFVNLCTYSNGILSESKRVLACDGDKASSLSMIVKDNGQLVFSWIEKHKKEAIVKFASETDDDCHVSSFFLPLEQEEKIEEVQTRGGLDISKSMAMTRGTTETYYEACDHCVEKHNKNCSCSCGTQRTRYKPTFCKCNQNLNHSHAVSSGASSSGGTHTVTIPADCAKDNYCCADCNCKEKGRVVTSNDPNEIVGVTGMGDPSTQRFVRPGDWLDYTIYFENKSTADVPAQEIYIDMALNPAVVDMKSLTFGDVVFGSQTVDALNGRKSNGTFSVTQKGTRYLVNGEATRDVQTGEIHWYMRSYDASAEENGFFPEAIDAGFLPPNDGTHRGEGHVTFRVKVKENAPDGAFINAEATIVFDANDPITTSPAWFNWVTTQESPVADNSTLRWDTSDDAAGTTYVVNYWSGDPDPTAPGTTITFNSDTLTTGRWKIADGLAVGRWYWNVTKTNGDDSSKTSTWSFDILATHSLTVNGGIGGGMYRTNTRVTAEANTVEGKIFTGWTAVGLDMSVEELSEKRLVFYMPDNDVTLTANYEEERGIFLLPGWNLVATPGELLEEDNAELFEELKPFVLSKESMAYIRASLPLPAGEPLWIYSPKRQQVPFVYEDANGVVGGLTDKAGWQLIGVGGKEAITLYNVIAAWEWSVGGWRPLEINGGKVSLKAGYGYFIYKE